MADDATQDAHDDFVTVNAAPPASPADASDSVVDPEVPSVVEHDPNVAIPPDEEDELPEKPSSRAKSPDVHVPSGPDKGTFRGHAAVEADRLAREAALVAARPPVA